LKGMSEVVQGEEVGGFRAMNEDKIEVEEVI
jgi:hypothetical protein